MNTVGFSMSGEPVLGGGTTFTKVEGAGVFSARCLLRLIQYHAPTAMSMRRTTPPTTPPTMGPILLFLLPPLLLETGDAEDEGEDEGEPVESGLFSAATCCAAVVLKLSALVTSRKAH